MTTRHTAQRIDHMVYQLLDTPGLTTRELSDAMELSYNHTRSLIDKAHTLKRITIKQDGAHHRHYAR